MTAVLKSFLTCSSPWSSVQPPHDSLSLDGIFQLNCSDTIVARQNYNSSSERTDRAPKYKFDELQSFFGLEQINPKIASLDGNYDCTANWHM